MDDGNGSFCVKAYKKSSVPKVPTREQLRLYNARKKCKVNKFASSRQMWYITYSDEICLFLEKRRENKTYEENKI